MTTAIRGAFLLVCITALGVVAGEGPGTTLIEVAKRGNVRYGPSLNANPITTLSPGTKVEAFGPVAGHPDWYEIRFPREGMAWVNSTYLTCTGDDRIYRVSRDGATVRSDSRKDAELVTQLVLGEEVETTGKTVGEWLSVYPANARAYMHASVLALAGAPGAAVTENVARNEELERYWNETKDIYKDYRDKWQADARRAMELDWKNLASRLRKVVDEHPRISVQLNAKKLLGAIEQVVLTQGQQGTGTEVVLTHHRPPPVDPGVKPPVVDPGVKPPVVDPEIKPLDVDPRHLYELTEPEGYIKGWVTQVDDHGIGTNHALMDGESHIVCYLTVAPEAGVTLSDFFWRRVGVKGAERMVGEGNKAVKVVAIEQIILLDK
jgi:uncharacterized protein YgiM (DUF1202 family)